MRRNLLKSLDDLHIEFHKMGGLASEAVQKSLNAFLNRDKVQAQEILDDDQKINDIEAQIEQKAIQLIALQSPVTTDLRKIITILKASSDIERLADHACRISKSTLRMGEDMERSYEIEHLISDMGQLVLDHLDLVMDAYVREDADMARQAIAYDKTIDDSRHHIHHLSSQLMSKDLSYIPACQEYIQVANCLERIGDYAKNVAEWVIYMKEGRLVDLQ